MPIEQECCRADLPSCETVAPIEANGRRVVRTSGEHKSDAGRICLTRDTSHQFVADPAAGSSGYVGDQPRGVADDGVSPGMPKLPHSLRRGYQDHAGERDCGCGRDGVLPVGDSDSNEGDQGDVGAAGSNHTRPRFSEVRDREDAATGMCDDAVGSGERQEGWQERVVESVGVKAGGGEAAEAFALGWIARRAHGAGGVGTGTRRG